MDEIQIAAADIPRTLYVNNQVAPEVHRKRALGGPIYNTVGLLMSAAIWAAASSYPIVRELAGWSAAGHGLLLLMSLTPFPAVGGGTILKWTLVARGKPGSAADAIVWRAAWLTGLLGGAILLIVLGAVVVGQFSTAVGGG